MIKDKFEGREVLAMTEQGGSDQGVPDKVRRHLKELAGDVPVDSLMENWMRKKAMLQRQMDQLEMVVRDRMEAEDPRGALMLTYSGSLVALGPREEKGEEDSEAAGGRWMEYASIKMRTDVPDILRREGVNLAGPAAVDRPLEMSGGGVQKTSALFLVAVCPEQLPAAEQDKRIREAVLFLTNGFVRINRTLSGAGEDAPDLFTAKSLVKTLAGRHGLTQKAVKELLDDYQVLLETGMVLGERVPLGSLGKLFLKVRPPQPSRVMKIPGTDRETTVPAKPASAVPRISFSSRMKEKAGQVDPESLGWEED